jgi:hypothetical protein
MSLSKPPFRRARLRLIQPSFALLHPMRPLQMHAVLKDHRRRQCFPRPGASQTVAETGAIATLERLVGCPQSSAGMLPGMLLLPWQARRCPRAAAIN